MIGVTFGITDGDIQAGDSLKQGHACGYVKRLDPIVDISLSLYIGTAEEDGREGKRIKYLRNVVETNTPF